MAPGIIVPPTVVGAVLLYHWYVGVPVPSWYATVSGGVTPSIHTASPTGWSVKVGEGSTQITKSTVVPSQSPKDGVTE